MTAFTESLIDQKPENTAVTTLTIVRTAPIDTEGLPRSTLLARLMERIVQLPWPGEASVEPALGRAIDEAFESLAREART